jgi:hypothetical protein
LLCLVDNWGNEKTRTFDDYGRIHFGGSGISTNGMRYCIDSNDRNTVWENRLCRIGSFGNETEWTLDHGQSWLTRSTSSQASQGTGLGPSLTSSSADRQLNTRTVLVYVYRLFSVRFRVIYILYTWNFERCTFAGGYDVARAYSWILVLYSTSTSGAPLVEVLVLPVGSDATATASLHRVVAQPAKSRCFVKAHCSPHGQQTIHDSRNPI